MPAENVTAYVLTILVIMAVPGPSHLLMAVSSFEHGLRRAMATAIGDLCANAIQILLTGGGFVTIVRSFPVTLVVLRWAGVGYLVFLGLTKMLPSRSKVRANDRTVRNLWLRGFLTSISNPKALLFFLALFPQFISTERALFPQVLWLGAIYLLIDGTFLGFYGLAVSRLKGSTFLARRMPLVSGWGLLLVGVYLGIRGAT